MTRAEYRERMRVLLLFVFMAQVAPSPELLASKRLGKRLLIDSAMNLTESTTWMSTMSFPESPWRTACSRLGHDHKPTCCTLWRKKVERSLKLLDYQLDVLRNGTGPITQFKSPRQHFDAFEPTWNCDDLERVPPHAADGSKWICGLDTLALRQDNLVYSMGSDGDAKFEAEVKRRVPNSSIYTFDPTLDEINRAKMRLQENQGVLTFVDSGLGVQDGSNISFRGQSFLTSTLRGFKKQLGHENRSIHILKVDIEGAEKVAFLSEDGFGSCLLDFHQDPNGMLGRSVDQLLLEIHKKPKRFNDYLPTAKVFAILYICGFMIFYKARAPLTAKFLAYPVMVSILSQLGNADLEK